MSPNTACAVPYVTAHFERFAAVRSSELGGCERGVHRRQLRADPRTFAAHGIRPRREEPAIGLVFDLLAHARPAVRCFERGALADEMSVTEHREGGADVGRMLHRELSRKLRLGSSLPAPHAREHIEHGPAEPRGTP